MLAVYFLTRERKITWMISKSLRKILKRTSTVKVELKSVKTVSPALPSKSKMLFL